MRPLILGAGGQVGQALVAALPDATALGHAELDVAAAGESDVAWSEFDTVVNAAAFTDVDGAESPEGRGAAWRANAVGPAELAAVAARHGLTLVHLSSEYVFDGRCPKPYDEDCPVAPLGAYGASKAAGDLVVCAAPAHYVVRPTWVFGEGRNFVRTMLGLARRGISPAVVTDQIGRPTFAGDVAAAVVHLLTTGVPYGTYHVTGGGEPASWAEVARLTFALVGHGDLPVRETTTEAYLADRPGSARRPLNSVLDLRKAQDAGIRTPDWRARLAEYVISDALAPAAEGRAGR